MSEQLKKAISNVTTEADRMTEADMTYLAGWLNGTLDAIKRKNDEK